MSGEVFFPLSIDRFLNGATVERYQSQEAARDLFALHAHIDDVGLAEADLVDAYGAAGILLTDPLTLRIKARYRVADAMLRVRGQS